MAKIVRTPTRAEGGITKDERAQMAEQDIATLMPRTIDQQIAEAENRVQRLKTKKRTKDTRRKIIVGATIIPAAFKDKARGIAREKGRDYYALRSDWMGFAKSEAAKGNPPKNSGAAFVAYCNKQDSLR